jgi:hypothetical protein
MIEVVVKIFWSNWVRRAGVNIKLFSSMPFGIGQDVLTDPKKYHQPNYAGSTMIFQL